MSVYIYKCMSEAVKLNVMYCCVLRRRRVRLGLTLQYFDRCDKVCSFKDVLVLIEF